MPVQPKRHALRLTMPRLRQRALQITQEDPGPELLRLCVTP
jgi:hypothetical protein